MTDLQEQTLTEPVQERARVLSGMRPTGRLHLGNYMGALYNWVQLQHRYDCFFFIADLHALTTEYFDPSGIPVSTGDVVLDFLAAGLDPALCTLFVQQDVPAHAELSLLLGNLTPLPWLERVPTYKDQQEQLKEKDLATYGFLGYPLLQSADILLYRPTYVPVGKDQEAHVEITREIARRFNQFYPGSFYLAADAAPWEMEAVKTKARKLAKNLNKTNFSPHELMAAALQTKLKSVHGVRKILPEPEVLLTPSPKLPGTDGRKMSKSYGNAILLSDPEPEVRSKLKTMVTDPARVHRADPGDPDVCPVFDLHRVFSSEQTQNDAAVGCRTAGIGCIECKTWLADGVVKTLTPIQERRRHFEQNPSVVEDILQQGAVRARAQAAETMRQVRSAMGLGSAERITMTIEGRVGQEGPLAAVAEPENHDGATDVPSSSFALQPRPIEPPPAESKRNATAKEEASQSPFSVTVGQVYDGPLDLLLDLIRKQNIDIYDIPIARITSQFLAYTHELKQTDVDSAGDFIYMASLLIHIKSKTLLPRDPSDVQGTDPEDPRRELVERLLDHERFKAAAQMLMQKQQIEEATWSNPGLKAFRRDQEAAEGGPVNTEREIAADTVDLVRVFQDILARLRSRPVLNVDEDSITVAQMIDYLKRRLLLEDKPVSLRRLLHNTHTERALICMFLGLLELVRLQAVLLHQAVQQGDILIKKTDTFDDVVTAQAEARDDWR